MNQPFKSHDKPHCALSNSNYRDLQEERTVKSMVVSVNIDPLSTAPEEVSALEDYSEGICRHTSMALTRSHIRERQKTDFKVLRQLENPRHGFISCYP